MRSRSIGASAVVLLVAIAWICLGVWSQRGRPEESKYEAKTAQHVDQQGSGLSHLLPLAGAAAAPIISVYTSKHGHDESHCAQPKDWKEWGLFAWCHTLEWIDAERVIAAFTVVLAIATAILGIATVKLWKSTDKLWKATTDADEARAKETEILQRAYINVAPGGIRPYVSGNGMLSCDVIIQNAGNLPATKLRWSISRDFSTDSERVEFLIDPIFHGNNIIPPKGEIRKGAKSVPSPEFDAFKRGGMDRDRWLYVWGRITYEDGFGNSRVTDFCIAITCTVIVRGRFPRKMGATTSTAIVQMSMCRYLPERTKQSL